jgi:S1-C subfamily serine protease
MKKILLFLIILSFIIFPQQAFSLTYDKKIQKTGIVFSDGTSGRSETEGFFGYGETPSCRKYNYTLKQVRQGQTIFYKNNNSVSSIEKGLFDCALDQNNKPMYTLREGVGLHIESGETQVFYKHDSINLYAYIKNKEGVWYYVTRNVDSAFWTQTNSNRFIRLATADEIKQAESLYKFYNNLDLSSRSAKIYGDKIYNSNDPTAKKENTPKKNDWMNKYNDNDIIPAGSGTGFFINRDGILLSNYHVIQGCASVSLYHNGVKYPANIIASDRTNDIAIISSSKKSNQYFRVDKDGPSLLEEIFVAGYPLGLKVSNALKVSSGRVSSLAGFGDNYANFQLDAAINPGNSGGPIINKKGNVVGIAVAYLPDAQGFNFGIKSSTVNSFVNSNKINFTSPNMTEMSTKDLSKLMNEATVFIECSMKVKDIKAALEKRDTKKVFYSELRN